MSVSVPTASLIPTLNRPTSFDAASHRRFRARADNPNPGGEGYTVDLDLFCGRAPSIDGVREYVSAAVPTDGLRVTWRRVGICSTEPETGTESDRDREFADRLQSGLSRHDLERELRALM